MGKDFITLAGQVRDALGEYEKAKGRGAGVAARKEEVKNLLFNNVDLILSMVGAADEMAKLEQMLADSDRDLAAAKKRVRELEKGTAKHTGD